jgi:NTE family protein
MADVVEIVKEAKRAKKDAVPNTRPINLALQGGGAHGAFAWGVLDRLLEDGRLDFEGITATSAGAMNAAITAWGMVQDGRDGARAALEAFWKKVSLSAARSPFQPSWWDRVTHNHALDNSPAFQWLDVMSRLMSPYQLNPLNWNPLRQVLDSCIDFDRLRAESKVKLFVTATNVRTGKARVFSAADITADAVMASACLPFLFQAVEIDGEPYWDGGYMGNPAIYPLIYHCNSPDVLIVHINPLVRDATPRSAQAILNQINEISFNSSLMREMRVIEFVTRLIDDGAVAEGKMKRMLVHAVSDDSMMRELSVSSKMNADWEFLTHLREVGRVRAEEWLAAHFDAVGQKSTINFAEYL